ncbi:PhzF family phenazine biosynthesis protein [Thalassotalea sp. G2M2-11]|uniref:PhzF family phenazine biosynthesis protein n=1 Tax=Thalassotalea sp. G2M2-11 TaxID=2787627 RepID=UPI0019D0FD50|nr:PhzF family phenazine biosynthesis protein [Thalassotalea sp. G2M2-11]
MTTIPLYQIDAFAQQRFQGNPAAVCPLTSWLSDEILQAIAQENNLSETAFFVKDNTHYQLRWMTPAAEVDLCGHATLAAADVIFNYYEPQADALLFSTRSGELRVTKADNGLMMDFPATLPKPIAAPEQLVTGIEEQVDEVLAGFDYIVVLANEQQVLDFTPDFTAWQQLDLRGVLVTAKSDHYDFVSRCFFPKLEVNEDPVTGSAHCQLAPYWAEKLNKQQLVAKQVSQRGGELICQINGDRVTLIGSCVEYLKGEIVI